MDHLTELFCFVDDFYKEFSKNLSNKTITDNKKKTRRRATKFSVSEIAVVMILFHIMRGRQFKSFYQYQIVNVLKREFPNAPSYQRMVELMPRCSLFLTALFHLMRGECSGISIADSTSLAVCDNLRIKRHKVFAGLAARFKTSTGWCFGFKLHTVINHLGELLAIKVTPGNVDDRKPLPDLAKELFGKLFADKGYLSNPLTEQLKTKGIELITKVRRNMKAVARSAFDHVILSKRSLIETVFDQLKNLCQIEHTRHRSVNNFIANLLGGVIAYCLEPKKPSLSIKYLNKLALSA